MSVLNILRVYVSKMGLLNKNINFAWYGNNCESCQSFDFYSGINLNPEFSGVLKVIGIKSGGYVYTAWSRDVHEKNVVEYSKLPDIVKNTLGVNFVKNGQGIDKFECGNSYIIEIEEGVGVEIDGIFVANQTKIPTRRLVEPCEKCPDKKDCECKTIEFIFKKFNIEETIFEGWDDPQDACFDNLDGVINQLYISTSEPMVGTRIFLYDRIEPSEFLGTSYQDDLLSINKQYIYSNNKVFLINNRTIDEIIDCDDIKPTPTPTLILEPPIEVFCIRTSSITRNNGSFTLQAGEHNKMPVWKSENNIYSYYEKPVGASDLRWMLSDDLGSKYGQFADATGGSGPYDVTWEDNKKYYHSLIKDSCDEVESFWISRGCINGERTLAEAGDSVSLNEDGTIVCFGARKNSDKSQFSGQVRVFRNVGSDVWEKMGQDIEGEQTNGQLGSAVSFNRDGSILAVGAPNESRIPVSDSQLDKNIGTVKLYKWDNSNDNWVLHGNILHGSGLGSKFGYSCALSKSGEYLVVGSPFARNEQNQITGAIEVYRYINQEFNLIGDVIYGEPNSGFGSCVDITHIKNLDKLIISSAGDKIAEVWYLEKETGKLKQKGNRIQIPSKTNVNDQFNYENAPSSISMDEFGDRVVVGIANIGEDEILNDTASELKIGEIVTFEYDGVNNWNKLGQSLTGNVTSVKLSETGSTLAFSSVTQVASDLIIGSDFLAPGAVFVYQLENNNWIKFGDEIYGKTHLDAFGTAIDFSIVNEKIVLVSTAPKHTKYNEEQPEALGQICVFESPPEFAEEIPDPVDCVYTQSPWTSCTQECDPTGDGPGTQSKTTTIIAEPLHGGLECPGTTIIQSCGETRCPIDCEVSEWEWSGECSKECDGGVEVASRKILTNPAFGGSLCPSLTTTRSCNTFVCPEDCEGNYESISECNVDCGGGTRQLAFVVTKNEVGTGLCPNRGTIIEEECNIQPCPVDCKGAWSDWSECSSLCDGGKQTRSFIVTENEAFGGSCVNRNKVETRDCNTQPCPTDCEGYYSTWSACSENCGGGQQTKSFIITKNETNGGSCAERGSVLTQNCNVEPCPQNCEGYWSEYGSCSKSCGGGVQTRSFIVTKNELYGGICPNKDGVESRQCNTQNCPEDCIGSWSTWSSCSRSCGGGTQTRRFIVSRSERYGGVCPDKNKTETRECNADPCPTNCEGYWSSWSSCTKSCGGGNQSREYIVTKNETNGGSCANRDKKETQLCNTQCCKEDCEGYWTDWSYNGNVNSCDKCGPTGKQSRKWILTKAQTCGGKCEHYNGKVEYRTPGESVCGCCPENCKKTWQYKCLSESDKISPVDNLIYETRVQVVSEPAKCGGSCSPLSTSTSYRWCDEKGPDLPAYKITGFGGTEGNRLEDLVFYPILKKGTGSSRFYLNVGTKKLEPPNGYYSFTCLDGSVSPTNYNITPCDGNRKYVYMTKSYTTSANVSLYTTMYRYVLSWGYMAGRTCSYSYIPIGKSSNSTWCPHWREYVIKSEDGTYRNSKSAFGWMLHKQYLSVLPAKFGSATGISWRFLKTYGWSYQPGIGSSASFNPSDINGYYLPYPNDGEKIKASNWKYGSNYGSSHATKYDQSTSELGFLRSLGSIEKVKTIKWGDGHLQKSSYSWDYME